MEDKVSEIKVLRSGAGYYIGTEYYDEDMKVWLPNSRVSQAYYESKEKAQEALDNKTYDNRDWL